MATLEVFPRIDPVKCPRCGSSNVWVDDLKTTHKPLCICWNCDKEWRVAYVKS